MILLLYQLLLQWKKYNTEFSSTLTIQAEDEIAQPIASCTTDETADVAAYSMETSISSMPVSISNFDNISLSYTQKLVFQLSSNPGQKVLTAYYDPNNKKFTDFEYLETTEDQNGTTATNYSCTYNEELSLPCQNIKIQFNADSGDSEFIFDHTALRSGRDQELIIFNGKLAGKLSISPQQLKDLPKTTNDNIQINGEYLPVIAATYSPQFDISELLLADGKKLLMMQNGKQLLTSRLYQPNPPDVFNGKNHVLQQDGKISTQDQSASKTVQFNQAIYQFSPLGSQTETVEQYAIDGSVRISKPIQSLNISSWYTKQDYSHEFTPDRVNITLVNHNEKILDNNRLEVHLRNNKLYSVRYFDSMIDPGSSSIVRLIILDYQCSTKHACKNVNVEPNGFGVKFNNTPLYDTTNTNEDLNSSITLNGGLIYPGR